MTANLNKLPEGVPETFTLMRMVTNRRTEREKMDDL